MTAFSDAEAGARREPSAAETPPLRASDADREKVVGLLHGAVGQGLLTLEEADERVAAAYQARYRRDLGPLTADLPAPAAGSGLPGWSALGALCLQQLHSSLTATPAGNPSRRWNRVVLIAVLVLVVAALTAITLSGIDPG